MDIEPHPKKRNKVLVTIEDRWEDDVIVDALWTGGLPINRFAFRRVVVDAWTGRSNKFPYTATVSEKVLGPIAIEAFREANPVTMHGQTSQRMGQTIVEYLQSFQPEPQAVDPNLS